MIAMFVIAGCGGNGGDAADGRKVKGTLHWVSAKHAKEAKVRLYDCLFTKRNPNETEEGKDYKSNE